MSTRRPLGTGPTTTPNPEVAVMSPRLLPIERAELVEREHQEHEHQGEPGRSGRRILGPGPGARI